YNIFSKVLESEYIPAREKNKDLPGDLCMIINRALEKTPDKRYQSAEEMLADLEKSMRRLLIIPSYRNLSRFMNRLFGKGPADEAQDTQTSKNTSPTLNISDMPGQPEKTVFLSERDLPCRKKLIPRVTYYVLFLVASALILLFIIKKPEPLLNTLANYLHFKVSSSEPASAPASGQGSSPVGSIPLASDRQKVISMEDASDPDALTRANQADADSSGLKRAIALLSEERFSEAAALFEKNLETGHQDGKSVSVLYSQSLAGEASGVMANMPERAKALLLKAVKIDPDNAQGHFLLGRIYTQQKDYTSAVASYQTAVELDPQMHNAFFNMGYIYAVKKDYNKAQEMFTRVIALSPPFLDEALYNLAIVQRNMGSVQDSIKSLERAIAVNPENNTAKKLLETLKNKKGH
ncbi:MAG: tetratricopeptide repeat protein, partial [Deltaproteobacteria bacterium]|nr:tetratricopeptide repeat protein [Deltaproteobacteria bacterium]